MSAAGLFRITRPTNAIVAGLAAVLGYLIATGTVTPIALLLIGVVACVTAAGNVLNDVYDIEIDRINRPDRPLLSGQVSLRSARLSAALLFLAGILLCTAINLPALAIAVINSTMLAAYAINLKKKPLLGNIAIAYLTASIFLFGGAAAGPEGLLQNLPLAGITFLATLSRELLKDAEDVDGDLAGGAHTVPMIIGVRGTAHAAFACACGAVVVSYLPIGDWWGGFYLIGIGLVDLLILAGAWKAVYCTTPACVKRSRGTTLLKTGMFAALLVFAVAAVI
ncbi:MAG: geranylgeranylglycerol-phosphate geranylgeranyltransferase [Methanomicrobiaceae archaeon]|uniref:(S)-2,3-di-o-geranylgeranylglyceryl phosphate synthase n=1 Tax=hydrocarbon metagenome TaxID=938273 RepID=A0A0W8FJB9_9ZZZZ|nr:geranylgeranylglycerol-phosphate geranylgeranyltransferase [Methanomicrobiaceae archaeon]MDD5420334.1 geranylgeranylglycerol-phosphate geranylgeranyltransferase [Methanomicrobiaceae archaeon]